MMRTIRLITLILPTWFILTSCGSNLYSTLDEGSVANEAASEMEKGNHDAAISLLEGAIADDPTDYVLISLLSEAYSQKFGVSLLNIAIAMSKSTSLVAGNELTTMWPALPAATDEVLEGVSYALELMDLIPDESKTPTDFFKMALLSISSLNLVLKSLDTDLDGTLSEEEVALMSKAQASTVLAGLSSAASAAAGASALGANSQKAAEKITSINSAVSESAGANSQEKLAAYFAK